MYSLSLSALRRISAIIIYVLFVISHAPPQNLTPRKTTPTHLLILLPHQISLSQPLDHKLFPLSPTVDILYIICGRLEMAGCIVALGDEDVIFLSTCQGLVERDWWTLDALVT